MKGVLFVGLVGVVLYMAIDVSHDLLSSDGAANGVSPQALSSPAARPMRSRGTDLPALSIGASPPRSEAKGSVINRPSASMVSAALGPAPSETPAYDPTEWLSVRLAARVHREPSVSSPITQFYQPGTMLQVVSRENGWVEISEPTSNQGGWMLEQYLAQIDGPHATQTALVTNASVLSAPPAAKPVRSARKRAHAVRPTMLVPDNVTIEQIDTRWERRAERRRFGFFFGRYAGAE